MNLRRGAPLLLATLASCNAESTPTPIPARSPGLIRLDQVLQETPSPHLTEALVLGDHVYVGNSNDQVAVYELLDDGGLALVLGWTGPTPEGVRCTTLAAHVASDSLYCGNDAGSPVVRFGLDDPANPARDAAAFDPVPEGLRIADMLVVGDELLMARFNLGLATARIDEQGQLSGFTEQLELGNLRRLDVDEDGRVWALTSDRGLLVFERESDGRWAERWQLDVDGAPLGLGVHGSRAAVGLGSAGLLLVELDPAAGLRPTHELHPPGVVSAADLRGDAAVAVTLLGSYAYDLRPPARWPEDPRGEQPRESFDDGGARLIGFVPAGPWDYPGGGGSLLDGALFERDGRIELITTDWTWVERMAIDLDGFPAGVDVRRGEWLAADDETVEIAVRNPTAFELRVDATIAGDRDGVGLVLPPRTTWAIELAAARFELDTPQLVVVRVFDGDELVDQLGVQVMRRPPSEGWPVEDYGRPAPGDEFPYLTLATGRPGDIQPFNLPLAGAEQRIVFYGLDCAAMWPEVEDMLWRVRSGRLGREGAVLVSHVEPTSEAATERWGLDDANWAFFAGNFFPPEFAAANPFADIYNDGFVLHELPSAAYHPTDYVVGSDGRVILVEREYRGEHPLVPDAQ